MAGAAQKSAYTGIPDLDLEALEIRLLLDAIEQRYGYDFHHYAQSSLKRRVMNCLVKENVSTIAELVPMVLHDANFFDRFLIEMSITVTKMFRNPWVFKGIRETILPKLKTYPRINIWHAGCATGEEAYSMAIMLAEEGLLNKTQIYATDYNNHSLAVAEKAIYPIQGMQGFSKNYLEAGGKASFSDYYQANYESVKIARFLRDRITFAHHNLMRDQAFAEMNMIFCRNVLIYFDQTLQNQVLNMMTGSLVHRGYLVLGDRETVEFSTAASDFIELDPQLRVYQKQMDTQSNETETSANI